MKITYKVLIILPWILLITFSCQKKNSDSAIQRKGPMAMEVKAMIVEPGKLENRILTTGTILANEEVEIRAEVAGRITSINFQEGSPVAKGDLLVVINDSELQAELKKLLVDQKLAEDDVYRKERLLEMKAVSREELDIARSKLGVIGADIELTRSRLEKTRIYAPFTGRIGLRYVSPGGYISPTNLIARMQQIDPVKIDFSVPEKYLSMIRPGLGIQFTIAGNDSLFTGSVYAIESRIDASTRTFSVRARCSNASSLIIPGAFSKVSIIMENIPDAIVLPSNAFIPDIRGEKVFLCKNGRSVSVYVTTGIRTETEVQVVSGLHRGDTVLLSGLMAMRDEMIVSPLVTRSR